MRQTLFFIPEQLFGWPLFGLGWLLLCWVLGSVVILLTLTKKHGLNNDTKGFIPVALIVALAIVFVLPAVQVQVQQHEQHLLLWQSEVVTPNGQPDALPTVRGLPIRGYGIFLLIATVSGVALATHRAKKVGLSPDVIYNLAFNMFVGGIVGARLFYVIQYWDQNIHVPGNLAATAANVVNFVEGGLVVYGSLIGALCTGIWFLRKHQLPALAIADLIAPSLALGLAIGRIGCLMNGCCYGGVCEHSWGITFPRESPPYYDQHRSGQFYGFRIGAEPTSGKPIVASVQENGPAAKAGLVVGDAIDSIGSIDTPTLAAAQRELGNSRNEIKIGSGGKVFGFQVESLPERTRPTHPTQIYSSVNALLLCLVTLAYFPSRRRDGEVFALLIAAYAITRFLLEVIRKDESGFWTSDGMTISQNVSIGMLCGAVGLLLHLAQQPRGSFWPQPEASA